jgi:hypothetical protein
MLDGSPLVSCAASDFFIGLRRAPWTTGAVPPTATRLTISAPPFKPLDQPLALQAQQPVDPELAVELIDLVLVADGARAVRLFGLYAGQQHTKKQTPWLETPACRD